MSLPAAGPPGGTTQVPCKQGLTPEVLAAQQGDVEALAGIFNVHRQQVYKICLRMTRDLDKAADLTQETFLKVLRFIEAFRGDASFGTWVHKLAVTTVLMSWRKERGLPMRDVGDLAGDSESTDSVLSRLAPSLAVTDHRLVAVPELVDLERAVSRLPRGYRQVYQLYLVEGYSMEEVADRLGCSLGNVKSQAHRLRKRLQWELMGWGERGK